MGPLKGIRIVEMAGIGPAPFCGMLLADMGAEVIRVDRLAASDLGFQFDRQYDLPNRSKRAVAVDLKHPGGVALVKDLISTADALIEGFRPGVMERLGLGPDILLGVNNRLVFGRMTGWGQTGPLRDMAGHDINYIALSGALSAIGPKDGAPVAPLNLVGDFGGGALYLAMGVLAALLEARTSGKGQVVDAAMIDGVFSLMTMHYGLLKAGHWQNERGSNSIDGGAPYYSTYRTKDGKYMAVGAIEAKFYVELLHKLGLDPDSLPKQHDRRRWPELRARIAEVFASRTRAEWTALFSTGDACVSPVLDMVEAPTHPQNLLRENTLNTNDMIEPAATPRFSRTPGGIRNRPLDARQDSAGALESWGIAPARIEALAAGGVIAAPSLDGA